MRLWIPLVLITSWGILALTSSTLPLVPNKIDLTKILTNPTYEEWLGYDELGRSMTDRLLIGARTSFLVAISVVFLTLTVGSVLGISGAYWGGWIDHVLVWVIDVFLAFPGILLAIALAGILGPGIENVVIALACVGWVGYARLARAQVLKLKDQTRSWQPQALGANSTRIIRAHLIPMISAPLIVEASFGLAGVVIAEAGLSFLGLGSSAAIRVLGKHDSRGHELHAGGSARCDCARSSLNGGGVSRQSTGRLVAGLVGCENTNGTNVTQQ